MTVTGGNNDVNDGILVIERNDSLSELIERLMSDSCELGVFRIDKDSGDGHE